MINLSQEFRAALAKLPPDQREALILVGASGFSYEEAAAICEILDDEGELADLRGIEHLVFEHGLPVVSIEIENDTVPSARIDAQRLRREIHYGRVVEAIVSSTARVDGNS